MFGILLPVVAKDFGWSTEFSTLVATWVSAGTFVVAIAVGPIVDYLGRRTALVVTTAGAALSSGLAALTFQPDLPHRGPFAVGIWILRASRERDLPIRNLRRKTQRPLLQLGTGRLAYWRVFHLGSERLVVAVACP